MTYTKEKFNEKISQIEDFLFDLLVQGKLDLDILLQNTGPNLDKTINKIELYDMYLNNEKELVSILCEALYSDGYLLNCFIENKDIEKYSPKMKKIILLSILDASRDTILTKTYFVEITKLIDTFDELFELLEFISVHAGSINIQNKLKKMFSDEIYDQVMSEINCR